MFIDASRDFKAGKNQNQLTAAEISKIVDAYRLRQNIPRYAHLASLGEIEGNGWNLNIPRYVDTFEAEAEIDLTAVRVRRLRLKEELAGLEIKMDGYLKELGY
jgi:type I restriction enzyme M protein